MSMERAKAVGNYLISLGIDAERFHYVGNGISKPIPGLDPLSEEGKEANRRTDVFFMRIE